jgi:transcriptional regulator with XRE-family HTH domain
MKQPPFSNRNAALDAQGRPSRDASIPGVQADEVKRIRKTLALTVDLFAHLLGVSPSSIFRYENVGPHAYHQGPVSKKLCLLSFWLKADESLPAMRSILSGKDGLAILAGLLETASALNLAPAPDGRALLAGEEAAQAAGGLDGGAADGAAEPCPNIKLPTLKSVAELILRAFYQDEPLILTQHTAAPVTDIAAEIENEARIMEAEARKLEAQARKLEAQARLNSAQQTLSG